MNKKTLLVAFPVMLALALTGCTNNEDKLTSSPLPSNSSATQAPSIPTQTTPEGTAAPEPTKADPDAVTKAEAVVRQATDDQAKATELVNQAKSAADKVDAMNKENEGSDAAAQAAEEAQALSALAAEAQKVAEKSAAAAAATKTDTTDNNEEKK